MLWKHRGQAGNHGQCIFTSLNLPTNRRSSIIWNQLDAISIITNCMGKALTGIEDHKKQALDLE